MIKLIHKIQLPLGPDVAYGYLTPPSSGMQMLSCGLQVKHYFWRIT